MTSPPSPQPYPYLPLNPSTLEIRLLTLSYPPSPSPNPPTAAINLPYALTLTHAPLTSSPPPQFSALSYVWGIPTPTIPLPTITINTHPIPITPNLHSALTRLARQRWQGQIWIDALCINQADVDEKNWQVLLMSRIYTAAEQVLVWLGPEGDGGALHAVRELGVLFREQVKERLPRGVGDWRRVEGFVRTVVGFSITDADGDGDGDGEGQGHGRVGFDFEAIWRLFRERPWWRRVWIIQEVVLARKAVVLCGADPDVGVTAVPWEDVSECMRLLEWMVLYPSTAPQHRRLYTLLGDIYPNVSHLSMVSDAYKRCLEQAGGNADLDGVGMSLLDAIILTSLSTSADGAIQATDPRDRIYGLLGVVREKDRRRIPIDYSPNMTINRVLFAVGKALLKDHGPDILSFCQRTPGHSLSTAQELPTWVPDWTAPRTIPLIGGVSFGLDSKAQLRGDASRGATWRDWAPKCRIEDVVYDHPVVSLRGAFVGRVKKVGQIFKAAPGSPRYLDDCRDWLLEISEMIKEGLDTSGNRELDKETWRVPIADVGFGKRADDEGASRFTHGFNVLTGRVPPPPELENDTAKRDWMMSESWDYRRVWKVYNRRALTDDAGGPGLAPEGTVVGDLIVVLAGGHVPFVIRRESSTSTALYRLVGPAYIFGLMDGEGVTDTSPFHEIQLV